MAEGRTAGVVYRQFRNIPSHLTPLPGGATYRIASALFKDGNDELSVDDGALCTPEECARRRPGCGVVSVPKEFVLSLGLKIVPDPVSGNPAHCKIPGKIRPDSVLRRLAAAAQVVVEIPGVVVVCGGSG